MIRTICAALVGLAIMAGTAPAQETAKPEEVAPGLSREQFREEVRAYLLDNPEVIYEAVQILERRRKIAEAEAELDLVRTNAEELRNDGFSYVGGNPEGSVSVVEFFDYHCPYCKQAHADVKTLLRTNPDIRFVAKEFPILGPDSVQASRAALAALRQGPEIYAAFWDRMMAFEGTFTDAVIDRLADRAGVDVARMRADMADPAIEEQIRRNHNLARRLKIGGTPTFVIGDKIIRGYLPLDEMNRVVELARNAEN
ncbi:MAG: DsbA family protein [Alphaproteobacteria bacterium]|nr:MAG: DsbA family protein [Alphaproteobacteria bacterium]